MNKSELIRIGKEALESDDFDRILEALRIIGLALPEQVTDEALSIFFNRTP